MSNGTQVERYPNRHLDAAETRGDAMNTREDSFTPRDDLLETQDDAAETQDKRKARTPDSRRTLENVPLADLIDSYPLLSDLHVHLLGTGDTSFWKEEMRHSPDTIIPKDILAGLGFRPPCSVEKKHLSLCDLADIEGELSNAFELKKPTPGGFEKYFAPRFSLRKLIAKNNPAALTRLIEWNAKRNVESGVHYAELSLGASWFKEPFLSAVVEGIIRAEKSHSVLFRLLIAFNRAKISSQIHDPEYLRWLATQRDRKLEPTTEPSHFTKHLEELATVKNSLENHKPASRLVVGLDVAGNEENRPYAPFLLPDFLNFASCMREKNPNFGFRLHLGEGISSDDDIGYVALRLGEYYISVLSGDRFRVRSGHGLGLLGLDDEVFNRWKELYPITRGPAADLVLENLKIATIEINLTSNWYLVKDVSSRGRSLRSHVMGPLLRKGFKIVLGTDDPGIFPNVSLRGEFAKAAASGLIANRDTFCSLVQESVRASFADQATIDQLSRIVSKRYPGVRVPKKKPPIPGFKPLGEPTPSTRGYHDAKMAEYERAKRAYESGNPWLLEEWYNKYAPP